MPAGGDHSGTLACQLDKHVHKLHTSTKSHGNVTAIRKVTHKSRKHQALFPPFCRCCVSAHSLCSISSTTPCPLAVASGMVFSLFLQFCSKSGGTSLPYMLSLMRTSPASPPPQIRYHADFGIGCGHRLLQLTHFFQAWPHCKLRAVTCAVAYQNYVIYAQPAISLGAG